MKKVLVLISTAALLFQLIPAIASTPQQPKVKSFAEWCEQKNTVSAAVKNTIEVLLKKAETNHCQLADANLNKINTSVFALNYNKISDLRPLANLSNLNSLSLSYNDISDLRSLAELSGIVRLYLSNNKITNIEPLATIGNRSDGGVLLRKWVGVASRYTMDLENNQIRDVTALGNLKYPPDLNLKNNPIVKKVCPFAENTCTF
jgi:internalin A